METIEALRGTDPSVFAMVAAVALVAFGADRWRVNRARRRVEDYLRSHRYTLKSIHRSWAPYLAILGSRNTIRFTVEVYDLEFNVRRRGWASASASQYPVLEDGVRVEWEGEPEDYGTALPTID